MIAEENLDISEVPRDCCIDRQIISLISELMKNTAPYFKSSVLSVDIKKHRLNEDMLSQIFIEQAQILIRKKEYPFNINSQYRDIKNGSKGYSDFYFYPNEQGVSTASLFSVESKRLPSPDKSREKEYVIGIKNNGGIERYKTEKHGKGLGVGGMLGFIESETTTYWLNKINTWICDQSEIDENWYPSEILIENDERSDYSFLVSTVQKTSKQEMTLDHLWITIIRDI